MSISNLLYIPEDYTCEVFATASVQFRIFHHPNEDRSNILQLREQCGAAIDAVCGALFFMPKRRLNFGMFHSNECICTALVRKVPAGMLMTPLMTVSESLIVLQSPSVDAANGDWDRMVRHLAHELVHAFNGENTGSIKKLGDSNATMRIEPWIDEGLAELVSAQVTRRPEILEKSVQFLACQGAPQVSELNCNLTDLNSTTRADAFMLATALVAERSRGNVSEYFQTLHEISQKMEQTP